MEPIIQRALDRFYRYLSDLQTFKMSTSDKQRLARLTRTHYGKEVMPDEAERTLAKALATIRQKMIDAGHREFETMTIYEVRDAVRDAGH